MTFCLTVKDLPYIRYNHEKSKNRQMSCLVATKLKDKIEEYKKAFPKSEVVKQTQKALFLIVDRSVDAIAPLLHEFTYQAMAMDLLDFERGLIYSFSFVLTLDTKPKIMKEKKSQRKLWLMIMIPSVTLME